MRRDRIDILLQKYVEGKVTPQQRVDVIEWVSKSDANKRHLEQLFLLNDRVTWNLKPETRVQKLLTPKPRFNRRLLILATSVAASVLLAIGALFVFQYVNHKHVEYITVSSKMDVSNIVLSDGTTVWLNVGSQLTYSTEFNHSNREVKLLGEGYFDVHKDKNLPFVVVTTHKYHVNVLGTSFSVNAYPDSDIFEVVLVKGSLLVESDEGSRNRKLSSQEAVAVRNGKFVAIPFNGNVVLWKDGYIVFENDKIETVSKKLSQCFGVKITVRNTHIKSNLYTAKFKYLDGIEHILNVLKTTDNDFDYTYDRDAGTVIIY